MVVLDSEIGNVWGSMISEVNDNQEICSGPFQFKAQHDT